MAPTLTPENRSEVRIWRPIAPTSVGQSHRKFIGKPVYVDGWYHSFALLATGGAPVHEARWWGYVREMKRQIPEQELIKPTLPLTSNALEKK